MLCEIRLNATERTTTNRGTAHTAHKAEKQNKTERPGSKRRREPKSTDHRAPTGIHRQQGKSLSNESQEQKPQFHTTSCFEKCQGSVCLRTITPRSVPKRIPGICASSSNHFRQGDLEILDSTNDHEGLWQAIVNMYVAIDRLVIQSMTRNDIFALGEQLLAMISIVNATERH